MFYIFKKLRIPLSKYVWIGILALLMAIIPILQVIVLGRVFNNLNDVRYFILFLSLMIIQFYFRNQFTLLLQKLTIFLKKVVIEYNTQHLITIDYFYYEKDDFYKNLYFMQEMDKKIMEYLKACLSLFQYFIRFISYAFFLASIFWYLGIVVFLLLVVLAILAYYTGNLEYNAEIESGDYFRRSNYLFQILFGKKSVQEKTVFRYDAFFSREWDNNINKGIKTEQKILFFSELYAVISILISLFLLMGIFIVIFLIAKNNISYGMYASLFGSLLLFTDELSYDFSRTIRKIIENHAFIKQYTKFLNVEEFSPSEKTKEISTLETIEFKNVSFGYDEKLILKNCSFQLEAGKQYGIVGENGSGKTTLIKVLLGLLPYEGEILINGISLEQLSIATRNKIFGVIFQDFTCYEMSIEENITFGDEKSITEVIQLVGLEEKLNSLPQKEKTMLGKLEDGVLLSLGEWQKIALARLLIRENACFIFDEPSASLDPISERNMVENLQKHILPTKLSIWITHRLGSCSNCDEILVLKDGKIIEQASFTALLAEDTYFKKLYMTQRSWYDV